jgi:hypothetical protein
MTDYAAEQEMEVEALRAILMDEFEGEEESEGALAARPRSRGG